MSRLLRQNARNVIFIVLCVISVGIGFLIYTFLLQRYMDAGGGWSVLILGCLQGACVVYILVDICVEFCAKCGRCMYRKQRICFLVVHVLMIGLSIFVMYPVVYWEKLQNTNDFTITTSGLVVENKNIPAKSSIPGADDIRNVVIAGIAMFFVEVLVVMQFMLQETAAVVNGRVEYDGTWYLNTIPYIVAIFVVSVLMVWNPRLQFVNVLLGFTTVTYLAKSVDLNVWFHEWFYPHQENDTHLLVSSTEVALGQHPSGKIESVTVRKR